LCWTTKVLWYNFNNFSVFFFFSKLMISTYFEEREFLCRPRQKWSTFFSWKDLLVCINGASNIWSLELIFFSPNFNALKFHLFNLHQNKGAYRNLLLFSLIHHTIGIKLWRGRYNFPILLDLTWPDNLRIVMVRP
jgi:hypothetical protein